MKFFLRCPLCTQTLLLPPMPDINWPCTPLPTHLPTSSSGAVPPGCISALNASLLHIVDDPIAMSPALMKKIASENNPRPLHELMHNSVHYWVMTNNQVLHVKFPAKVDHTGQYECLGPYFNMTSTGLDIQALQKARAQFELVALDDEADKNCPSTAITCSHSFFVAVFIFFDEVESRQPSDLCQIRLSDIGKRYHSFPKGTFKARFIPPSAPRFVVKHLAAHPPSWTWTTKGGPNKDRSFQVPTIPITCNKAAPRAIHWVVAVFHSFKAHLNPIAIDGETGKVKPGWLRLYQNNLYVHLRGQMKETAVPKRAPPPTPKPSSTSPPSGHPKPTPPRENLLEAELSKLRQEIAELRDKFHNYITSHEACCMHHSNSPSESSEEEHTTRVTPRPPPVLLTLLPDGSSKPIANPPTWLVAALAQLVLGALRPRSAECAQCSASVEQYPGSNASVYPFWHTYDPGRGNHYALIVMMDALFANLLHANKMAGPKITHADVGKSTIPLSPSPKILRISDLPDPHGRYAGLLKTYGELTEAKVTTPDVCDRQGLPITPAKYDSKISDGDIVKVEVILKLWCIQLNPRGNVNGSHTYQAILQSMKLLLFHTYSKQNILQVQSCTYPPPLPTVDKGKHKADGNEILLGQLPTKKCVPMLHVSAALEEMEIGGEDE
ncbi:hypothetical protein EDC04DRAFT_2611660 [Pisolithus marmoratus]|nr:hypothetical protein EDC04DRAFT_2611660 [Pisolithus marmoratus]